MAENKKSFILYADLIHTVRKMPAKKRGDLFLTILEYVNDENPAPGDSLVDLVFEPIKQQLKRDLQLWEKTRGGRSEAGKAGGKKSGESRRNKANEANASKSKQNEANEAVTVNATVTVNDNVIDINNILSEHEIGKTIQYCLLTLSREYDSTRVAELWKAFLINAQKDYYETKTKRITHFRNWIKTQPNGTHQQASANGIKLGTGAARIEALKKW